MRGINYIRNLYNLSLQDLGNILGVTKSILSKWERGEKPIPKKRITQLSEYFNIPSEYFQMELAEDDKLTIQSIRLKNDTLENIDLLTRLGYGNADEFYHIKQLIDTGNEAEAVRLLDSNEKFRKFFIQMKKTEIMLKLKKIHSFVDEVGNDENEIAIAQDILIDINLSLEGIIEELGL